VKEDKFWKYALYISLAGHIALIPVASAIFNKVTEPFHESTTTFYEVSMAERAQEQASENSQPAEQQPPQEESTPSEPQEAVAVPEIPESMKPEPRPEQPKQEVPKQKPSTLPKQQPITSPQSNAALQAAEAAARAKAEADAAARAQEQEARTTVVNSPYPLADPKPTNPTPGQTGTVYVTARIYESGQVADVEVSGDANSAQQNAVAAYVPTIPFAPGTNKFGDPLPSVVRFSVVFR
jgi:hypothetical protein